MSSLTPFHLALPVHDLDEARRFYGEVLGCAEDRNSSVSANFNFFGHQLVCHLKPQASKKAPHVNPVDGKRVPVPHFGIVMEMEAWEVLAAKLKQLDVEFIIEPYIRFKGKVGEQATFFIRDPSGNALEFKAFRDIETQLFAK